MHDCMIFMHIVFLNLIPVGLFVACNRESREEDGLNYIQS